MAQTWNSRRAAREIVAAAGRLTQQRSLLAWSVRDVAAEAGTSTSAVYHHVGGRDELARRVVESLVVGFPRADPELAWQEWFRATLGALRTELAAYPGVAQWLMMHGPAFAGAIDIVDAGVACLERAGFGDRAAFAYAAMVNSVVGMVAIGDMRTAHEADGPRDHEAMMAEFATLVPSSPGLGVLSTHLLAPMAVDPAAAAAQYSEDLLDTVIRGLEARG